jgi:hypothetical protein
VLAGVLALVVPTAEPHADNTAVDANISVKYHLSFRTCMHSLAVLWAVYPQEISPYEIECRTMIGVE